VVIHVVLISLTIPGPPLGGVLFQYAGYRVPFYVSAALAFLDFLARLWVDPPVIKRTPRRPSQQHRDLTFFQLLTEAPVVLICLAVAVVSGVYSGE
jgi:predicted MFS family arabinose efflux permease